MTKDHSKLSDIRVHLERWYRAAIDLLLVDSGSRIQTIPFGPDEWCALDDRLYCLMRRPSTIYTPQTVDALKQLEAYANLEQAARRSAVLGPLFGQQVGNHLVTHQFDFWSLASAAIPSPEELSSGSIKSFNDIYHDLNDKVSDAANYVTICPLHGISFEETEIDLEPGVTIERLTPNEITSVLKLGVLTDSFGMDRSNFILADWNTFALKKRWQYPRRLGGPESLTLGHGFRDVADTSEYAERLLQCLGLLTHAPVFVSGTVTLESDDSFALPGGHPVLYQVMPVPLLNSGVVLGLEKRSEIQRLWTLSQNETSQQLRAFSLALRRLGYALQRNRLEDRLLDVCIAAEAFYLTDLGKPMDRGEMRYRLSLRAAAWSENSLHDWTQLEIFHQIQNAYDVRSAVAHGGRLGTKDLKIKGKVVPLTQLADFVRCVEDIVRAGLYKAFLRFTAEKPDMSIDWNALVLANSLRGDTP